MSTIKEIQYNSSVPVKSSVNKDELVLQMRNMRKKEKVLNSNYDVNNLTDDQIDRLITDNYNLDFLELNEAKQERLASKAARTMKAQLSKVRTRALLPLAKQSKSSDPTSKRTRGPQALQDSKRSGEQAVARLQGRLSLLDSSVKQARLTKRSTVALTTVTGGSVESGTRQGTKRTADGGDLAQPASAK